MSKEIFLQFDLQTGETHVETSGFTGSSCKAASDFVVKALGESKNFQKKAEWYETNVKLAAQNGLKLNSNLCG